MAPVNCQLVRIRDYLGDRLSQEMCPWWIILIGLTEIGRSRLKLNSTILWVWHPGLSKRKNGSWANASIFLSFSVADAVWPLFQSFFHFEFLAMVDHTLELWAKLNTFLLKWHLSGYFITAAEDETKTLDKIFLLKWRVLQRPVFSSTWKVLVVPPIFHHERVLNL